MCSLVGKTLNYVLCGVLVPQLILFITCVTLGKSFHSWTYFLIITWQQITLKYLLYKTEQCKWYMRHTLVQENKSHSILPILLEPLPFTNFLLKVSLISWYILKFQLLSLSLFKLCLLSGVPSPIHLSPPPVSKSWAPFIAQLKWQLLLEVYCELYRYSLYLPSWNPLAYICPCLEASVSIQKFLFVISQEF